MKRAARVLLENSLYKPGTMRRRLQIILVMLNFFLLLSTISIPQVSSSPTVAAYYPSTHNPVGATRYISGALSDLKTDNAQYMTYRAYTSASSPSAKTDAFITYRSNSGTNTLNSPKNRAWDGDTATWSSETEMATTASPVRTVRTAICPKSERALEKIVVTLSDDGYLDAYVFDGVSWSVTNNIGQAWTSSPSDARRPFDVTYESSSGDALLVYGTTVPGGTVDLAYRVWSYTSGWGPEQYLDDAGHSTKITVTYVALASEPTSDKIGVTYIDSTNNDANAMIWSGSSWGNSIELTGAVAISTEECAAIASESTSGAFMVVAGEGEFIKWARFTTSWSSVGIFDINGGATSAMNWLRLSSSPDNRLMLTSVDGASDLCTAVWDGNSLGNRQWSTASESVGSMTATSSVTAMRFTAQASKAVTNALVYIHAVATSPSYRFGIETSTTSYLPSGTYVGGTSNYAVATPTATGWLNVTLPSSATLTAGTVYHITVRYNSGTIGTSNYIALRRLGTTPNMFRPRENAIDPWLNTIFSSTIQDRDPVFALRYNDGTYESTPYDTPITHSVYGANWFSERWAQIADQTILGVNLPLAKFGTPPDSLYIVLRNETDSQDVATLTISQADITTTLQWYERYFSSPVKLVNGKAYRLILRSPSSTSSNYFTCPSLTTTQSGSLTYGGTSSLFSSSANSGSTWTDTNERDLTYILLSTSGSTGWVVHPRWDNSVDTNAQRCADFAWEYKSQPNMRNQGLLVYGTSSGQITWRRFRAPTYMTSSTNVAMGTSIHPWVQLKSNPRDVGGDTRILGAVLEGETAYDLGAIKWDGAAFTMVGSSAFTSDTTTFTYECFELEFQAVGDPTGATCETEFSGTSNTETWTQLVWTVDCSFTTASVTTTLQLYNYQTSSYPTSGDGYLTEVIGTTDTTKTQTITINPAYFRDSSGNWKIKLKGVKSTNALFDAKVDLVKLEVTYADISPPTWSSPGTNSTLAGQPTLFHVKWTDDYGLSGFIFATNNTGHWVNDTFATMNGAVSWSNVTKILNSTASLVQWRVWANDTSNNWGDTGVLSVSPLRSPRASLTYSPPAPYTADTITFNASASYDPDGILTTYFWTFGDGKNNTGAIVTHSYTDNGVYTVTLTVTDNDGLTDTEARNVAVLNRLPVASFTESLTTAPTGTIIYFDASASYDPDGTIATYFWTFGDGANATGVTVAHAYTDDGIYTVTLAVTDNDGAASFATASKTITNRTPVATFTESATTVYTGTIINFASSSYDPDGIIVSYFWTFGDGTNSTGVTVSHSYSDDGAYTVILTITDDDGAATTVTAAKTVLNRSPVASFTESKATAYTDEVIYLDASSSYDQDGSIISYFWTFGDGMNATGVTVEHAYADEGIYIVTLLVTDDDGATASTSASKTILNKSPIASFTESAENVLTQQVIIFNASASYDADGFIVSYFWTFDDGSNAAGFVVEHSYVDNGVYTVTLTLTDDDGATATASSTKVVSNRPPVALFTESAESVYIGQPITFDAGDSYDPDGTIVSYFWSFGDGANATGIGVSHAYSVNGTFTVVLTVTDNDGAPNSESAAKTILYNNPPVASFTESAETANTGDVITFNASTSYDSDGFIVSYLWTFGDGTNAAGVFVSHAYVDDGIYTVTLAITDNVGATGSSSAYKTVLNRKPIASFTESAETVLTGEIITFNASGSYDSDGSIVSYFWTFGDGANATGVTVSHAYSDNGVCTVTLQVTDDDGATTTSEATKAVTNRSPLAAFTESATTVYTGEAIVFNASQSYDPDGSIVSYLWDFGDGTNATGLAVSHSYANDGVYAVTLTVTDNDGATASTTSTKTALNRPPVASFTESAATIYTNDVIHFNASASYDSDGSIVSYLWTFGDGTNAFGVSVSHTYIENGVYTLILTVTDNDGATATVSAIKTVLNRQPIVSFTESAVTVLTSEVIHLDASGSYDPDGTIVSYFWTFGDGASTTGLKVSHAYSDDGTYTVSLTVADDDGATATATAIKTILNRSPVCVFTESAFTVYTGTAITFDASTSYDSDGTVATYFWNFGDGNTIVIVNPVIVHTYLENGTYTVTLTITDNDEATASASSTKTVLNRPPVAVFTHSPPIPSTGQPVTFDAKSSYDPDGSVTSYSWNFGDGNTTTLANPVITHTYTDNGIYTVTLTVTDNDGLTDIETKSITVSNRAPVASFTESATTVFTNVAVSFDASSSYDPDGSVVSYFWAFGDGSNAAGVAVSHTYANNGNYVVALTVTDNDGTTDTATATKNVLNRPPVAVFTESAETAFTGETIHFNASQSYDQDGSIVSYSWDFGDGVNTAGRTVSHSYVDNGIYTVTLVVKDDDGAFSSSSAVKTVLNRPPIVLFTESVTTVYTGEVIHFNASSSYDLDGTIIDYSWTFGDGANAKGTVVEHAYSDEGVYLVTLTIRDDDGAATSASSTKTVLNRPPVAVFTETAEAVLTGEIITFDASSSFDPDGSIASYLWSFGDGASATDIVVIHAFADDGRYTVTLTITDDDGVVSTVYAAKTVGNRSPTALFVESATTVYTNEIVYFNASGSYDSDGSITSYFWNFGDGTNATGMIVSHAYTENDAYTVTLVATDDDTATGTATATKTVLNRLPIASFTENASAAFTGVTIRFNASSSYDPDGTVVSYFWTFGDGMTATGPVVEHSYANDGSYTVMLAVTDDDGATATSSATKTIMNRAPVASFTESETIVYTGELIQFDGSASYDPDGSIVSLSWDFGDGTNSNGNMVSHFYAVDGTYVVTLTITDNDGATDSATAAKTVLNRPPTALFTESATTVYIGEVVRFNASQSYDSDGYIATYSWAFGDGATATGKTPTHAYVLEGTYTVILVVTDNEGAISSASATKTVLNNPPVTTFTESAQSVNTGKTVNFDASGSYDPDGAIVSYFWNFGDGATASGATAGHAYSDDGSYTVTLTVTDNDGATKSVTSVKTVLNRNPVASFSVSATTVYTGTVISFDASESYDSDGVIVSYFWAIGDGTNATGVLATHAYADDGDYVAALTVRDDDEGIGTSTITIRVLNRLPIASFTESAGTVYTGEVISFNAIASYDPDGTIVTYLWNFGDGASATGISAGHAYVDDGSYTVSLTVTDDDGAIRTATAAKTVLNRPPIASFTESAQSVVVGQVIYFDASASYDSDGLIVSYLWDFGDDATATGVTAQHAYSAPRVYTVVLTVTDNNGAVASQSSSKAVEITRPVAVFTESAQTTYTGATITFDASTSYDPDGHIVSYFWTFGDGANASGMVVAHSYYENGSYMVTLIVTDNDGATDTADSTKTILNRPPVASFTESAYTVYIGQSIAFNASASYDPDGVVVSYSWAFGDGTNALGAVVEHTYLTNRAYTVTLTVADNDATAASTSASKTILWNEKPVASFTESAQTLHTGEFLSFNASTSYDPDGTIVSYLWDFGDGTNATGINVAHAYLSDGAYVVGLTITDNVGARGTANATKMILNRAPVTYFTESATTVYTHETITFNASGSYDNDGAIVSYLWDFRDGANATGIIVSYSYADNGTYTVTLTATDDDGAYNSTAATKIVLNRPPVAVFTESTETIHTGQYILFNASGSYDTDGYIISYLWDFGDGTAANGMVVEHAYSIEGEFTVTLTVTDEDGSSTSTTSTKTIVWNEPPVALFTESAATTYQGETITLDASNSYDSDGSIVSYSWTFGDRTNATGIVVEHVYSDVGTYVVTLTVTDDMGATSFVSATKTVLNKVPVALFTESSTTVYTLEAITFNASNSYDPDGGIVSYSWTFGDGANAVGPVAQHTYAENGQYTVILILTDNDGATGSASAIKTVLNRHPLATFTTSPVTVYTGDVVVFDASGSYDVDGTIVGYFWQFGDGATAYSKVANHAYAENRAFTVTLAVTDNDMATSTASKRLVVFNRAPIAVFVESAQTSYRGAPIGFDASGSYDPDGSVVAYSWNFDDGATATGITANHAYALSGSYTVTLTVIDNDGGSSSVQATKTILGNILPVASFAESAQSVQTGEAVAFDASASYDPDGSIVSYSWTFGDGGTAAGSLGEHVYLKGGSYAVALTVTDNRGAGNTASATKSVLNRLPVASFTESVETAYSGESIVFDASSSYDIDGSIVNYLWNFGDGTNANGAIVSHAYYVTATFIVTLTVTDDNSGSNSAQATKTILGGMRDVAIADIVPNTPRVYKHQVLNVSVVVANEGTEIESFNVTLYSSKVYGWHLVEMGGHLVWYSDGENSADFLLLTSIALPSNNPTLTFETRYETESLYDYCFTQISTDGGTTWVSLENAYTTSNHQPNTDPDIIANIPGFTGTSANWPTWKTMTFNLNSYAGKTVLLGFRYMTDVGYFKEGWYIDSIAISGIAIPNQAFVQQTPPSLNAIQTLTVSNLAPATQTTVVFSWNTTNTLSGRYSLSAMATPVRAEIDTSDNFYVNGVVEVMANPDIDGDGDVDIFDVVYIASIYGCKEGDPRWNPRADLVEDKMINIFDVVVVASHYGEEIPQ